MSGHSHWAGIKHKKGLQDAKRGKIFTKFGKLITIAARDGGGGNPDSNFQLRLAIERARSVNMPKENIERAIKRGTGELKGAEIEELVYEGMGPGGVMMIIKSTTDNRNRAVSEIKTLLTKAGGKMGEKGSSMWNFDSVGMIYTDAEGKDLDEIELAAIDAGAKDTKIEDDALLIFTEPDKLNAVRENITAKGVKILEAGLGYVPKTIAEIDENTRLDYEKLLETLDDHDDVDEIYDNL